MGWGAEARAAQSPTSLPTCAHPLLAVADYVETQKQAWSSSEIPKPKVLNLNRSHPDYKRFLDWKRVSYLRTMQHEKIGRWVQGGERQAHRDEG